ncbi:hypothetical protein [Actinoplanes xinjiangensis]|uniref:hypothetical protein n=1 Tax=Actinoplanes xinjiangensis TaxID=512350 RepID=UPI001944BB6A|nr:hypothetical protein [Actinoplanes xinjiangensis]GIF45162.1 hypothetical protein Axi01nite_94730 [Actinoplanes xinjiangensis]
MTVLAEQVDGAIGVDTHRDTLAAVAVSAVGAVLAHAEAAIDVQGVREVAVLRPYTVPGTRCWALEGTGSYGAGLAAFLDAHGERVVEVCGRTGLRSAAAERPERSTPCVRLERR